MARTRTKVEKPAEPAAGPEPARHTLRSLTERLHPAVLDVVAAPRGVQVELGDAVIFDPGEPLTGGPGAVVLGVGVDTDRARVALLHQLGDVDAAALIVKGAAPLDPAVLDAANGAGVAVLVAPPPLSWSQLHTLLLTAAAAAPPDDGGEPAVPLGDLFALANAVAAMVGGATTIEDPHNRVLAYSNLDHPIDPPRQQTILGRQVPSEWIQRLHDSGVFRRLWHGDEVIRIADFIGDDPDYLPRLAVAVRAGGELLGSLWVIEGTHPLGEEAERTLRDAAQIAALHLLRHRTASDVERRRRADALGAVLDGADAAGTSAETLGIAAGSPVTVVAFDVAAGETAAGVVAAQRVADLVAVYCESYRRQAACAPRGGRVYALLPDPVAAGHGSDGEERRDQHAALAQGIVDRAGQALRLQLRAGIGSTVSGLDGVVRSRREADDVLEVLRQRGDRPVAAIDQVRDQVVLLRLRQLATAHPELTDGKVGALAQQDAAKATAWVPTLRAYFDAFGDMAAAAAAVNVHPNTFRYRLRRITEVFGLDLADPDQRLVAELQLRFLDLPR